jgi:DNA-binding GntR family transcriptional regulator
MKELAAEGLRKLIIHGQIKPGTKVTEREVARLLGIGRMPARDALMLLEHQGLVVSNADARYVIELNEQRLKNLYAVRLPLETLAFRAAATRTSAENRRRLERCLSDLKVGCDEQDAAITTPADLALHQEIWEQSGNPDLLRIMTNLQAVFFVLVMQGSIYGDRDWQGLYQNHRQLVDAVSVGDGDLAANLISQQLTLAVQHSLAVGRIITE